MENINPDCDIQLGILIHQLQNHLAKDVINMLHGEIKHTFTDGSGMRVYFSRPKIHDKFVRKRFIQIDGIFFNIYSTVTCLTVFGISSFAFTKETIKFQMEARGIPVSDLCRIPNTSHYRIILDIPEVLANFELSPISLDPDCGTLFPIAFFCRTCRKEGHKRYQCPHSWTVNREAGDTGNRTGGTSSNNARNSEQGNAVKPSVSGVRNTGGGAAGTQSFAYLSARQKIAAAATPSTSKMATDAETYLRDLHNYRPGSNNVGFGTPRKNLIRPVTNTPSGSEQKYPCKEIVKAINKVHGPLPPKRLPKFLEVVYHKQHIFKYALEFTGSITLISGLTEQIRMVISQFYRESCGSDIAKKQIKILENLCRRLEDY